MITRSHRFHGHASLGGVYKYGQLIRGPWLTLKYTKNPKRRAYRLAVVVSRKVHKSAVTRNRIRRRIYEVVRSLEPQISEAYDLIFTVFSEQAASLPSDELTAVVNDQLLKAEVIGQTREVNHGIVGEKES